MKSFNIYIFLGFSGFSKVWSCYYLVLQANSRSLSRSTRQWTLLEVCLSLKYFYLIINIAKSCLRSSEKSLRSFPGDLDDDIEFDDVDSEGSGSDEGDDIDGI